MNNKDKVACRTPAKGRDGVTNIPRWKYEAVRDAILTVLNEAGSDGFLFKDLSKAVGDHLTDEQRAQLGSLGWHTTTVKLNMEVEGEIRRMEGVSPQRLTLGHSVVIPPQ